VQVLANRVTEQLGCLVLIGLDEVRAGAAALGQRCAARIERHQGAARVRHLDQSGIRIWRRARRQAARQGHQVAGTCRGLQSFCQHLECLRGRGWPWLVQLHGAAGAIFDHGDVGARLARDLHKGASIASRTEPLHQHTPHGPGRQPHDDGPVPHLAQGDRDVDALATQVQRRARGPVHGAPGHAGQVQGAVHTGVERDGQDHACHSPRRSRA